MFNEFHQSYLKKDNKAKIIQKKIMKKVEFLKNSITKRKLSTKIYLFINLAEV